MDSTKHYSVCQQNLINVQAVVKIPSNLSGNLSIKLDEISSEAFKIVFCDELLLKINI